MIAATRDTSTRSTPTPIAVTARRSEAEARREPCGGGQVAAQHQSEPYQRHAERRPQRDQRPKRRPPARNRVDLVGPATVLVGNLRLEIDAVARDRKSTRLNSSHTVISYAVFCLKKKSRVERNG